MSDLYDWSKGGGLVAHDDAVDAIRYHIVRKTVCAECHTEMYPGGTCDTCGCAEQVTLYFTIEGKPIECRNDVPRIDLIEGEFPQFEE